MKKIMFNDKYGLTDAVLSGRKTVTRRLCNFKVPDNEIGRILDHCPEYLISQAPYKVGEIVAVAQSYADCGDSNGQSWTRIAAFVTGGNAGWSNKMFVSADLMPHQIQILDIRSEQLQEITDEDCMKEGIKELPFGFTRPTPREAFSILIDKISGRGTWDRNPFVWRIEFKPVK